jgi:Regulator of chromosome condensation (RCC1) repeat
VTHLCALNTRTRCFATCWLLDSSQISLLTAEAGTAKGYVLRGCHHGEGRTMKSAHCSAVLWAILFSCLVSIDPPAWATQPHVSRGFYHTVGLKADGTVVATGENLYGQCNVNKWRLGPPRQEMFCVIPGRKGGRQCSIWSRRQQIRDRSIPGGPFSLACKSGVRDNHDLQHIVSRQTIRGPVGYLR